MKHGRISRAWQQYVMGRFKTPRQLTAALRSEEGAMPPSRFHEIPKDDPTWRVPKRLAVLNSFFTSEGHLRQSLRADWAHCDPRLMGFTGRFIYEARRRGIPLYAHCALRDKAEQNRLFAAGHSKARYPRSAHNIGEAVDIVHGVFHWDMSRDEWRYLHLLGRRVLDTLNAGVPKAQRLTLNWGGDFTSLYDPAHWEIADFRSRVRNLPPVDPLRLTPYALRKRYAGFS